MDEDAAWHLAELKHAHRHYDRQYYLPSAMAWVHASYERHPCRVVCFFYQGVMNLRSTFDRGGQVCNSPKKGLTYENPQTLSFRVFRVVIRFCFDSFF